MSIRVFCRVLVVTSLFVLLVTPVLPARPQTARTRREAGRDARRGDASPPRGDSQRDASQTKAAAPAGDAREEAYRANNLGVALLEQFKHKEGAEAFRRALQIDPRLSVAQINLAIALYNVPDLPAALQEAERAATLAPRAPQPAYILGLIAKTQNRTDEAIAFFRRVLETDARDTGTNVNLGQLYAQRREYEPAIAFFRTALDSEPYNGTALYGLATALLRGGQREEGQRLMQRFQELRQSGSATITGQNYLEQGRYAEAVASTGAEAELVSRETPAVAFNDATAEALPLASTNRQPDNTTPAAGATIGASPVMPDASSAKKDFALARQHLVRALGGGATLFDFDADGDLDLFRFDATEQRLFRNDGGKFVDVTERSGLARGAATEATAERVVLGAVAGDYDNDERPDLLVLRYNSCELYRNEGGGRFASAHIFTSEKIEHYPYLSIAAAFVDADHDGDLDIFIAGLADLSQAPASSTATQPFTFPANFAGARNLLLRNNGDNTFADISAQAGVAGAGGHAVAVVPTDYDNRRDVDLLLLNYDAPPQLFRNLRDGTFRDVAREAGLDVKGNFTCAASGDTNKDDFTDFFFGDAKAPGLFAMSDGRGRFVTTRAPEATAGTLAAQFFDYDNDGLLDLVALKREGLRVWRNTGDGWTDVSQTAVGRSLTADGHGLTNAPSSPKPSPKSKARPKAGSRSRRGESGGGASKQYDVRVSVEGKAVGSVDDKAVESVGGAARGVLAAGDVDGDGDVDLFLRTTRGPLRYARNDGGNRNASVHVRLAGKVSNRGGVGTKVELRAGSLRQKLEAYAATPAPAPADINFGLGRRKEADAVRVIWPAGIVQAETEIAPPFAPEGRRPPEDARSRRTSEDARPPVAVKLTITELDRKPSSCPFLFAWNGERFEFITDFMGGGEMGDWVAPGIFNTPDPDEYVRIRGDQLRPRNGRYELRVTNELEEVLFVDRLELLAVAHPLGTEVYPNEGLGNPTSSRFTLYATRGARPPLSATDEHGHDVLQRITRLDRRYPDDFALHPIRGYAAEHTLTLDLGQQKSDARMQRRGDAAAREHGEAASHPRSSGTPAESDRQASAGRELLLLTGWTDYAFSSNNVAASQSGLSLKPPALQVRDGRGEWQTVIENIGIPVGRPQTVTVDLTGKFLSASREVRIVTNMRIYWDQILFDTSGGAFPFETTRLRPSVANLRWRGFSAETSPDRREPFGYDYERVSLSSPWKTFTGRFTREGDVRELLAATDDIFVVSRSGDELSLSFDAAALAPLPDGWTRTFLLYADGFSKEMDINSASPDQVSPLPFHGMKNYPYRAPEHYPLTPERQAYLERYNTRVVTTTISRW